MYYRNKLIEKVGLVGMGISNLGVYRYLKSHYPKLQINIRKPDHSLSGSELSDITEDMLFLSPSVRRDKAELIAANQRGVILTSDVEFFLESHPYKAVGVSGSDGKTTTVNMISHIIDGHPTGNCGESMTPHLDDKEDCRLVCELSSFQLCYGIPRIHSGLITNVTENHLNWHSSFREYIDSKENLLFASDIRVLSPDCPICKEFMKKHSVYCVFSTELTGNELICHKAEEYLYVQGGHVYLSGRKLFPYSERTIGGRHNLKNLLGAIGASLTVAEKDRVIEGAERIAINGISVPHRKETLCYGNKKYINSSIDSSPLRTVTTVKSIEGEIILILGGRSKGLGFELLSKELPPRVVSIILTGENRFEIEQSLRRGAYNGIISLEEDFDKAVILGARQLKEGQSLLLSPASVSFDRFTGFEERGERFKTLIKGYNNSL